MIPARTSAFYVANLGSEVSRLQSALAKGDAEMVEGAMKRARGIFDMISALPLRPAERSEIRLLQEVIEDVSAQSHHFSVDAKSLQDYFLPFAYRVLNIKRS